MALTATEKRGVDSIKAHAADLFRAAVAGGYADTFLRDEPLLAALSDLLGAVDFATWKKGLVDPVVRASLETAAAMGSNDFDGVRSELTKLAR